jgi:hypothetical protein
MLLVRIKQKLLDISNKPTFSTGFVTAFTATTEQTCCRVLNPNIYATTISIIAVKANRYSMLRVLSILSPYKIQRSDAGNK